MEDKALITEKLKELLQLTRSGCTIESMTYERLENGDGEYVHIKYTGGYTQRVNVTWCSGIALIHQVVEAVY